MNYRSRQLLDLSHRVQECQLQLPGICVRFSSDGCEPAHSNMLEHGKGTGIKANDYMHVAACHHCHAEYDQGHRFSKSEKRELFLAGWARTIALYFRNGWLKVGK